MRTYEELMTLTGSTHDLDFASELRKKGIKHIGSDVYETTCRYINHPEKLKDLGPEFQQSMPKTIERVKAWVEQIEKAFSEQEITEESETDFKASAESLLWDGLRKFASTIDLSSESFRMDPVTFYGMCTILELNPNGFTLEEALLKLENQ